MDDEGREQPIEAKMLSRTIENAQKKVEQQNFLIRKRVLEYDDVMNQQREVVYRYRREILEGRDMSEPAKEELRGVFERIVQEYTPGRLHRGLGRRRACSRRSSRSTTRASAPRTSTPRRSIRDELTDRLHEDALEAYGRREGELGEELMRELERGVLLQIIDERWREHLYDMDYLREGIHLRGFAQRDPLVEYKNEGFTLFRDLMNSIWEDFGRYIFHVQVQIEPAQAAAMSRRSSTSRGARASPIRAAGPEQPSALYDAAEQAGRGHHGARRGRSSRRCPRSRPVTSRIATGSAATTPAGAARARSSRSATERRGGLTRFRSSRSPSAWPSSATS